MMNVAGVQSKDPGDKYAVEVMKTFIQDHTLPSRDEQTSVAFLETLPGSGTTRVHRERILQSALVLHAHQYMGLLD